MRVSPARVVGVDLQGERDIAGLLRRDVDQKVQGVAASLMSSKPVVHHDLDHLFGVWTKEEADEFDAFLKEHRSIIDPEMWK